MVLHQAFRARHLQQHSIGGEVRHGVTGVIGHFVRDTFKQTCMGLMTVPSGLIYWVVI